MTIDSTFKHFLFGLFPGLYLVFFFVFYSTFLQETLLENQKQDSQQCSLPPYHLTCKVAEIVLFTINPTTLSTTKLFNYFLTTLSPKTAQPFNILPISFQHVFAGRAEDDARRGKTKEGGFRESPTGERKTTER